MLHRQIQVMLHSFMFILRAADSVQNRKPGLQPPIKRIKQFCSPWLPSSVAADTFLLQRLQPLFYHQCRCLWLQSSSCYCGCSHLCFCGCSHLSATAAAAICLLLRMQPPFYHQCRCLWLQPSSCYCGCSQFSSVAAAICLPLRLQSQ